MSAKPGSDCVASDSEIEIKRNDFNGLSRYDGREGASGGLTRSSTDHTRRRFDDSYLSSTRHPGVTFAA
jgi:hypothetical protein